MPSESRRPCVEFQRRNHLALSGKSLAALIRDFVESGRHIKFRALGESMFPFIKNGDMITVSPYNDMTPERGDIVAFVDVRTQGLMVHRIIRVNGDGFVSKGDNCFQNDGIHRLQNILGFISEIDDCSLFPWAIDFLKYKKWVAFFSQIGVTVWMGRLVKKLNHILWTCILMTFSP